MNIKEWGWHKATSECIVRIQTIKVILNLQSLFTMSSLDQPCSVLGLDFLFSCCHVTCHALQTSLRALHDNLSHNSHRWRNLRMYHKWCTCVCRESLENLHTWTANFSIHTFYLILFMSWVQINLLLLSSIDPMQKWPPLYNSFVRIYMK